jgi:hypothetical protein
MWWKLVRHAYCKRRCHIKPESRRVIVINNDNHVGLDLIHPVTRGLHSVEQRFPVWFLGLSVIDGCTN